MQHLTDFDSLVPQRTNSYEPIAYSTLTDIVKGHCNHYFNDEPTNFNFTTDTKGNKFFGTLTYKHPVNPEIDYMIGFRTSYDKTISNQFCAGGQVIVCSNMMFVGDVYTSRKHTTYMMNDIDDKITELLSGVKQEFITMERDINIMQQIEMSNERAAELLGTLTFNKHIIGSSTANKAWETWKKSKFDGSGAYDERNVWRLYNSITETTKNSNPLTAFNVHRNLHKFFTNTEQY